MIVVVVVVVVMVVLVVVLVVFLCLPVSNTLPNSRNITSVQFPLTLISVSMQSDCIYISVIDITIWSATEIIYLMTVQWVKYAKHRAQVIRKGRCVYFMSKQSPEVMCQNQRWNTLQTWTGSEPRTQKSDHLRYTNHQRRNLNLTMLYLSFYGHHDNKIKFLLRAASLLHAVKPQHSNIVFNPENNVR